MKKAFRFLRSMQFGVLLLIIVMAFSFIGSLIPQGRTEEWYLTRYPAIGQWLVKLSLHSVFSSWYFVLLIALLCANLTLCSLIRFRKIGKAKRDALSPSTDILAGQQLSAEEAERLHKYLLLKRYKRRETDSAVIYYKNMLGYYGSFVVHLSILLTLVFGGLVLGLSRVTDYNVIPGTSQVLPDRTELFVKSFRTSDDSGRTDYASVIDVTSPDGRRSVLAEISVNYPLSFNSRKYYQYSFGTVGAVTAKNTATGGEDILYLNESSFLSEDGRNGIWFEELFPGYLEDSQGNIMPLNHVDGTYPNPIYRVMVSDGGDLSLDYFRPGEAVKTGGIVFTFEQPVVYPGIRVKDIPDPFPAMLYIAFALMVFGFWICFFVVPSVITVCGGSFTISGLKTAQTQLDIAALLQGELEE